MVRNTLGIVLFVVVVRVVMVSTVVTPRATRAGDASRFSQNDTQLIITIRILKLLQISNCSKNRSKCTYNRSPWHENIHHIESHAAIEYYFKVKAHVIS